METNLENERDKDQFGIRIRQSKPDPVKPGQLNSSRSMDPNQSETLSLFSRRNTLDDQMAMLC